MRFRVRAHVRMARMCMCILDKYVPLHRQRRRASEIYHRFLLIWGRDEFWVDVYIIQPQRLKLRELR